MFVIFYKGPTKDLARLKIKVIYKGVYEENKNLKDFLSDFMSSDFLSLIIFTIFLPELSLEHSPALTARTLSSLLTSMRWTQM